MRKYIVTTLILFASLWTWAQDNHADTLAHYKVKEEKKYFYVHAFENADSCLFSHRKFDSLGRITYERTNMKCMGWPSYDEIYMTYEGNDLVKMRLDRDGLRFSESSYVYEPGRDKPSTIKTHFFQTNDSMMIENHHYFNENGRVDSTDIVTTQQDGSVVHTRSIARYNDQNELVQIYSVNDDRMPLEMATYEMTDDGRIATTAFTTYGEKSNFTQIFYTYDQSGRVASTYNTINQKQEFFYTNGLLRSILSYNPEGKLETEYIFEYVYRK